jgi:lycopene cyclase domain-containing protein
MYLYSILLLCSFAIPFGFSFEKNLQFYKKWKYLFPAILIVGANYIIMDVFFTKYGIWGFNSMYHSSIIIFNLPLEEWAFFLVIPYASIFLHYTFAHIYPKLQISHTFSIVLSVVLISLLLIFIAFNTCKIYTVFSFSLIIVSLLLSFLDKVQEMRRFYLTFLVILIPFSIVNAILTGSFIDGEVVWYNPEENLGIRLFTIPIEDIGYAFSLILFNLLLMNRLQLMFNKVEIFKKNVPTF